VEVLLLDEQRKFQFRLIPFYGLSEIHVGRTWRIHGAGALCTSARGIGHSWEQQFASLRRHVVGRSLMTITDS
jgi:hypothetical protein